MTITMYDLAEGLQHSNISEVSELAKAYLELHKKYESVSKTLIKISSRHLMEKHKRLLKRLAESGD